MEGLGFPVPQKPKPIGLPDLFGQIVGIHDVYCQAQQRAPEFVPIRRIELMFNANMRKVWLEFELSKQDTPSSIGITSKMNNALVTFRQVESRKRESRLFQSDAKSYTQSPQQAIVSLVQDTRSDIWCQLRPGHYRYFAGAIDEKKRLPQVASNYLGMFYLGSIARYRPDLLRKYLVSRYGWLFQEFIETQPVQL
ncbi:MAG: hypothetical protein D6800_02465, partial [Candidatus Zixiibacteriota bacterium]